MEAIISEVMESWPLQLILDVDDGQMHVQLAVDVHIRKAGRQVGVDALQPGVRLRVELDHSKQADNASMTVSKIEILN